MSSRLPLLGCLLFGYALLYVPVLVLIGYSFNASRLVTVWGGFSTHWYTTLLGNERLIDAALRSLKIASVSASVAVVLGCAAAYALVRFGRFTSRRLLGALLISPLVMPDVVIGLSLLLLFVFMQSFLGWPAGRDELTIGIAHVTLGIAYACAIVRARLTTVDTTLEDAAADLGASPMVTFVTITLPLLAPGLVAAWLLAFTLSLDDLVIASFVSGPGSTTLPIHIFSSIRLGVSPQINALATLMVVVVAVLAVVAARLLRVRPSAATDHGNG
ncbi:MAG: ABC transporter permease subunit [Gammaproteobacteria bacterium]|nr:ABC transporter permease subunit [Gammaproteobacteria bacterium]